VPDSTSRARKRAKPSFEVPSDVTAASQSGWVFRSDGAAEPPPPPAPPRQAPGGPTRQPTPVLAPPGPLRFAWMPLAIAYSTILAMLPQRGPRRR